LALLRSLADVGYASSTSIALVSVTKNA